MTNTNIGKDLIDIYKPAKTPCIFVVDPNANWEVHDFIIPDIPEQIKDLKPEILEFLNDYPDPSAFWQERRILIYGYVRKHSFLEIIPMEIMEIIFKWCCPVNFKENEKLSQQNKLLYKMSSTEFLDLVETAIILSSAQVVINHSKTMRYFKSNIGPKYFTTLTKNTFCNQMEYINMNKDSATILFLKIRELMEF